MVTAVDSITERRFAPVKRPRIAASSIAPTAPTEALSVGVAKPARIEPSTATISARVGIMLTMTSRQSVARSAAVTTSAGALSGSRIAFQPT